MLAATRRGGDKVDVCTMQVAERWDSICSVFLKSNANEVYLWHGTNRDNADVIAQHGLDPRVCRLEGLFGAECSVLW